MRELGHWNRLPSDNPNEETYEFRPYLVEVRSNAVPNRIALEQQLRHALEQQALAATYPGRRPRSSEMAAKSVVKVEVILDQYKAFSKLVIQNNIAIGNTNDLLKRIQQGI